MDAKDLIETLTTIGFFALSVGAGLLSEYVKKRKRAKSMHKGAVHSSVQVADAHSTQPPVPPVPQSKAKTYSFTPQEEGGCSLAHDHSTPLAEVQTTSGTMDEDERREILRTLIVGEVLATPRFRN